MSGIGTLAPPEPKSPKRRREESLAVKAGHALSWNYAGAFARLVLNFGVTVTLARLLGPAPFGEMAVAGLLFSFGILVSDIGVSSALIQKEDLNEQDIRFCFTCQMLVGGGISFLLAASSPLWAAFFHQPHLKFILPVLAPVFLLQSFGTTSSALLSRAHNARPRQFATIISYLVGYALVAVPMAVLGFGVWSLVAAYLVQAFLNSALLYWNVRHAVKPLIHREGGPMLHFGLMLLGANVCNWGITNLDNTIVGRVAGPFALGLYSRAFNLAQMPTDIIVTNLHQVILPAFARLQEDLERLAQAFLALFGLMALILMPPFFAMAVIPDLVVVGLYGPHWVGAVQLFRPLALALPIHGLMALSGPTLASRGKPRAELRIQLFLLVVVLIGFEMSIHVSVSALCWTVLGAYVLRFVMMTQAAIQELQMEWREIVAVAWPSLAVAGVSTSSAFTLHSLVRVQSPTLALAVVGGGTALLTVSVVIVGRRILIEPILRNSPNIREALAPRLQFLQLIPAL